MKGVGEVCFEWRPFTLVEGYVSFEGRVEEYPCRIMRTVSGLYQGVVDYPVVQLVGESETLEGLLRECVIDVGSKAIFHWCKGSRVDGTLSLQGSLCTISRELLDDHSGRPVYTLSVDCLGKALTTRGSSPDECVEKLYETFHTN